MSCDGECHRKRFWVCIEIICTLALIIALIVSVIYLTRTP